MANLLSEWAINFEFSFGKRVAKFRINQKSSRNAQAIPLWDSFTTYSLKDFLPLYGSIVGRVGERRNAPPPEIAKIVGEIWCYLPEVYTFGEESEIQEFLVKNSEKLAFYSKI